MLAKVWWGVMNRLQGRLLRGGVFFCRRPICGLMSELFFTEPLLVVEDRHHSVQEPRWHALGQTFQQRLLHITFTLRRQGTEIRVISARPMLEPA